MIMKSLMVLMMLGAFSLVSFAQTSLQLNSDGTASASAQPGPGQTVDFKIDLAKDTYVCATAKSKLATWNATFDGKNVTQTESCFEITQTRSYPIKLANKSTSTGAFTPYSVIMDLSSSTLLKLDPERSMANSVGRLAPKEVKSFVVKLEAGKRACLVAKSDNLTGFTASFENTSVPLTPDDKLTCLPVPTEARYYKIVFSSNTTNAVRYDLTVGYQD